MQQRNIRPQSSHRAEPLWTDSSIKSEIISVRELISTLKEKKKQAGNEWSNILPKFTQTRKTTTITMYNHTTFKLQSTRIQNMRFAVYFSNTPVTLNQDQGH